MQPDRAFQSWVPARKGSCARDCRGGVVVPNSGASTSCMAGLRLIRSADAPPAKWAPGYLPDESRVRRRLQCRRGLKQGMCRWI